MCRAHRKLGDFADVAHIDFYGQSLRFQAIAIAGRAWAGGHVARDFFAGPFTFRLKKTAFQIGDDALKRLFHLIGARAVFIRKPHDFIA